MVRFRCIRSNGNARKRHETGNGNTGYPSCFQNGLTCFCHVSVYGLLQFRPVMIANILFGYDGGARRQEYKLSKHRLFYIVNVLIDKAKSFEKVISFCIATVHQ